MLKVVRIGIRGSKQVCGEALSCGSAVAPSQTIVHTELRATTAPTMPNVIESPPDYAFWCFPHASPALTSGAGKRPTVPKDRPKSLISLRKTGAGEGIRTLDPNLGKVRNRLDPHHRNFPGLPSRRNCDALRFHPLHHNACSFTDTAGLHNLSSFHELLSLLCRSPQPAQCRGGGHNDW